MLHLFALLLILIALVSGLALLSIAMGFEVKGSTGPFWLLYLAGLWGGISLLGKATSTSITRGYIRIISGLQVLLGIIAAILIMMDKLMLIQSQDSMILWVLFVVAIVTGIWGISQTASKTSTIDTR